MTSIQAISPPEYSVYHDVETGSYKLWFGGKWIDVKPPDKDFYVAYGPDIKSLKIWNNWFSHFGYRPDGPVRYGINWPEEKRFRQVFYKHI
jgi:hypothetical protein